MTTFAVGQRRLLKLADILNTADAEHRAAGEPTYDQRMMIHWCGTPACALGHWAAANPRRFTICRRSGLIRHKDLPNTPWCDEIGAHEFGITNDEALELFGSDGCGGARTAKQAATYIRKFVKRREREARKAARQGEAT